MVDFAKVYEDWDSLPDCRIRIDLYGNGGEHLWGKELPDGTFGINNMPWQQEYTWQDIVRSTTIRDTKALIHRRWKLKLSFDVVTYGDDTRRRAICDALPAKGLSSGFWSSDPRPGGVTHAYALFPEDLGLEKSREVIAAALDGVVELKPWE